MLFVGPISVYEIFVKSFRLYILLDPNTSTEKDALSQIII